MGSDGKPFLSLAGLITRLEMKLGKQYPSFHEVCSDNFGGFVNLTADRITEALWNLARQADPHSKVHLPVGPGNSLDETVEHVFNVVRTLAQRVAWLEGAEEFIGRYILHAFHHLLLNPQTTMDGFRPVVYQEYATSLIEAARASATSAERSRLVARVEVLNGHVREEYGRDAICYYPSTERQFRWFEDPKKGQADSEDCDAEARSMLFQSIRTQYEEGDEKRFVLTDSEFDRFVTTTRASYSRRVRDRERFSRAFRRFLNDMGLSDSVAYTILQEGDALNFGAMERCRVMVKPGIIPGSLHIAIAPVTNDGELIKSFIESSIGLKTS